MVLACGRTAQAESDKAIFLMEGYDLRATLDGQADWDDYLLAKIAHLNFKSEPFLSVKEYLADS